MKKIIKIVATLAVIAAIVSGFFVFRYFSTRTKYNESLVYGNSAGNFYNGGLFCEAEGFVYFSNPMDNFKLYRMTPDGRDAKKLTDDSACFINADSNYLYYARNGHARSQDFAFLAFNTNSLCRIPIEGGKTLLLDEAPALYVSLIQNDLYYIHYDASEASTLYQVGIDGKEIKKVTNEPLLLSPGREGTLCYAGVNDDHNISLWNPTTNSGTVVYEGVCYQPIDTANYLYFLDAANDYHLMRLDKSSGTLAQLTDCRVDYYNLTRDYAYYQKNAEGANALCRVSLDEPFGEEIVSEGVYTGIHTTSQYVYFSAFQNPSQVFQTSADGPIQVQNFFFQLGK